MFQVRVEESDSIVVFTLLGDAPTDKQAKQFGTDLRRKIDSGFKKIAVDLTKIDRITQGLLLQLNQARTKLLAVGGNKLCLVIDRESQQQLLQVTGIDWNIFYHFEMAIIYLSVR